MRRFFLVGLVLAQSLGAMPLSTGLFTVNGEHGPEKYISIRKVGSDLEIIFIRTILDTLDKEGNPIPVNAQYRALVSQKNSNESTSSYPLTMLLQKTLPGEKPEKQLTVTIKPLSENEFEFQLTGKTTKAQKRTVREIAYAYMPDDLSYNSMFLYQSEDAVSKGPQNREFLVNEKTGDSNLMYFTERDGNFEKFEASDFSFGLFPMHPDLPTTTVHILFNLQSDKKKLWKFDMDMVRTPASEVSGTLAGANRKAIRLTQSPVQKYKYCKDGKCEVLLGCNNMYFLPQEKSMITLRLQSDEKTLQSYGKKQVFTITTEEDKVTLKDKNTEKVFVKFE
ncbi:MAG: hypothetical protein JNM27_23330 [Leptospirales bacterium]|nr:hypothetical protein [Leptospirales bacterium]